MLQYVDLENTGPIRSRYCSNIVAGIQILIFTHNMHNV